MSSTIALHVSFEAGSPACLATQLALVSPYFHFPNARITGRKPHPSNIYVGAGDPNSSPHVYVASALTSEPHPSAY